MKVGDFPAACSREKSDDYPAFWKSVRAAVKVKGAKIPEKSSQTAWDSALDDFEGVHLSGKLRFSNAKEDAIFDIALNPMKIEKSFRLSRKFGSDRFMDLQIPGLGEDSLPKSLKTSPEIFRSAFVKWLISGQHVFLGRVWRPFFIRPEKPKKSFKGSRPESDPSRFRIFFFAENGNGFSSQRAEGSGEVDPRHRQSLSVEDLIRWFMPFENNINKQCLKFFSRLALGKYVLMGGLVID